VGVRLVLETLHRTLPDGDVLRTVACREVGRVADETNPDGMKRASDVLGEAGAHDVELEELG